LRQSALILRLIDAGILVPADSAPELTASGWYDGPRIHARMLADTRRTQAYLEAIAATVGPDDVVLDLGTGTGVLAMAAARAGARRVYAIEATAIAEVAAKLFVANGFADRITLLRGRSTDVDLPERATLLVAELVGSDPLDEGLAFLTEDAKRRLLTPDARLLPAGIRIFGTPVHAPDQVFGTEGFSPDDVADWTERYGLDFRPLTTVLVNPRAVVKLTTAEQRSLVAVTEPAFMRRMDLHLPIASEFSTELTGVAIRDAELNGILISFVLELAPGIELETTVTEAADTNHWRLPLIRLEPRTVSIGQRLTLSIQRAANRLVASWLGANH